MSATLPFSDLVNQVLRRNYGAEDALRRTYGLPSDEDYDMIVLSPCWSPEELLRETEAEIRCLQDRSTAGSWLVELAGRRAAWLRTGAGAGSVVDACLALVGGSCENLLFLGTCTALKSDLVPGELVVPNKAISGTGATRYLELNPQEDPTFLQERRTPPRGILRLSKAAIRAGAKLNTRTVFSTDSLIGALLHRDMVEQTGADVLDREAAAFARCMTLLQRPGVALLTVTGCTDGNGAVTRIQPEDDERLRETVEYTIGQIVAEIIK